MTWQHTSESQSSCLLGSLRETLEDLSFASLTTGEHEAFCHSTHFHFSQQRKHRCK